MSELTLSERRKDLLTSMMKDAIYEAAVAVLSEHGATGVTMERVAEKAGVAKGSLYNYFPNKLALLQFVHERAVEPLKQKAEAIFRSPRPALDKIEAIIRVWFTSIDEQRSVFNFLFLDTSARELLKGEEASGRAFAIEVLSAIIQQGVDEGVFRPSDTQRTAWLLFGASRELCDLQLTAGTDWPVPQLVEDVMTFFLHGVSSAADRLPTKECSS